MFPAFFVVLLLVSLLGCFNSIGYSTLVSLDVLLARVIQIRLQEIACGRNLSKLSGQKFWRRRNGNWNNLLIQNKIKKLCLFPYVSRPSLSVVIASILLVLQCRLFSLNMKNHQPVVCWSSRMSRHAYQRGLTGGSNRWSFTNQVEIQVWSWFGVL